MNDAPVGALGLATVSDPTPPPGGLAPGLEEIAARGIARRGHVLVWADSIGRAEEAASIFGDLTGWECGDSSVHLEDHVAVPVPTVDDAPMIAEPDQRTLLHHGWAFALRFSALVYTLDPPAAVRCITAVNATNGTFRFHQIRPGESWNGPGLETYRLDKMIVVDIRPHEVVPPVQQERAQ